MKSQSRWLFIILLALVFSPPSITVMAQATTVTVRVDSVDTSQFPQVALQLHVWDNSGLPITGLTAESFSIVEDTGASFHPTGLENDQSAPLRVVLAIDVSGSMSGQPLADAKVAAARFLDHLEDNDQVALVAFSDKVDPDPEILDPAFELAFTSDLTPVYDKIESLKVGRNTHLYLALAKSVRMLMEAQSDTRVVLLLSDGRNEPSNIGDPEEPIQLAQQANIPIFVIGLGNKIDELYLRHLVSGTGGLLRTAPSSSDLANLFEDMATLLKTRYVLNYTSQLPSDGQTHTLTTSVTIPQGQSQWQTSIGPLPPPAISTQEATQSVDVIATSVETRVGGSTSSFPETTTQLEEYWGWLLAGFTAVVLSALTLRRWRRRPRPTPEICAQCGFNLTGKIGNCPQCGGLKRLPKVQ